MDFTKRTSHPSRGQIHFLLDFLESHPKLARGFPRTPNGREYVRRLWEKLAIQLNCLEGCEKSLKQWIKYWADKKSAVKKKAAAQARGKRVQTEEGEEFVIELSEIEERILVLMGGENFPFDDSHTSLHPLTDRSHIKDEDGDCPSTFSLPLSPVPGQGSPSHAADGLETPSANGQGASTQDTSQSSNAAALRRRLLSRRRRRPLSPSSHTWTQFTSLTERMVRLEEQRLQLDRRNSDILEAYLKREVERDLSVGKALEAVGEAVKLLVEVFKQD